MRRRHAVAILAAALVAGMFAVPDTAAAVLENEYGMRYAGRAVCVNCHAASVYGATSHDEFATPGAEPSADHMWPAGRIGVGLQLERSDIGFTLGAGTGARSYLVKNALSRVPVAYTEVAGEDRYMTSVRASVDGFASADTVVVATGEAFPDALGGAALAGAVDGPLLLTRTGTVPAVVIDEIERLGATKIYVLGGEAAVAPAAFAQLDALGDAVRLSGGNRYQTAAAVAAETIKVLGGGYGGAAFMATGTNFPDALGASPIMYAKGMPLVLVDGSGAFVLPSQVTSVKVLGGTGAVPASVESALGARLDGRLQGATRYATAAAVADYGVSLGMTWNGVGIVTGESFPDALSAGPLLGSKNAVMLLSTSGNLAPDAAAKLATNKGVIAKATFVGGTGALSAATRNEVRAILTGVAPAGTNPFGVSTLEWDPAHPDQWEMGPEGISVNAYTCGGCHHLGWVAQGLLPTAGKFMATATTPVVNGWVTDPAGPTTSPEKYIAGASIQCEVCHGTGEAGVEANNHWAGFSSNVKILKGTQLLDSQVCGQCHGRYKGGNTRGYTPDQNLLTFVTPFGFSDIPAEENWNGGTNAATGKPWDFFPSGQNRTMKHSYYSEWILSAHSYRGQYYGATNDARVTPYQKVVGGYYSAKTSGLNCAKCHTGEGYAKRKGLALMTQFEPTGENVGYMGQECVTCHIPHGADAETGMAVREPDAEPTLAGVTMTSICEDCHNWQLEVEGRPLVTAPLPVTAYGAPARDLSSRGGYSHPTREIYNGVGMFEVDDAGKFMPGVACEDCHMPATKSDYPDKTGVERHDDRSWKRYSHRMFIMEPGDAEEWGLAPWGDSCSPCHVSQTQHELQQAIEQWQDEAAQAATVAADAYAAAWTAADDPGALEDPDSDGFVTLMGRAYYNQRSYLGEGSLGAHNPAYIVAGLKAATKMAKSVNGVFAFVDSGSAFPGADYIVGNVRNGDDTGAAGAEIVITVDGVSSTVLSDANGNFAFLFADSASIDAIAWKRCSDPAADLYPSF
ncbi:MAG: ammonia-forming cytochrome c nitrite reductase subunit c552 [Coriobacteriia bacterium]|nr:ammonia-forming cytochrome c nitrite reductase subunit c552 [Coriobacteriia bacterium]